MMSVQLWMCMCVRNGISVHLLHPVLIGALIAFTWDCGTSQESCLIRGHTPFQRWQEPTD